MDLDDERLNSSNDDIWGPYHEFVDPFSVLVFQSTSNMLHIHIYPVLYISRVNYWHSSLLVIISHYYWFCNRTDPDTYYWIQLMDRMSGDTCSLCQRSYKSNVAICHYYQPCISPFRVFTSYYCFFFTCMIGLVQFRLLLAKYLYILCGFTQFDIERYFLNHLSFIIP